MIMDMDPITPEEARLIKELRNAVEDLGLRHVRSCFDKDEYYVRWLRARDLNLLLAEDMLRKSMEWRKENEIDSITSSWEPSCASIPVDYPLEICGYSRQGCPIAIIPFSYWDVRRGVEAGHGDEMIRYIDHALETIEETNVENATAKKANFQATFIFDMNGLSFWQLASIKTVEVILDVVRRYEAHHPELLHSAYVINASRIFHMLFNMVKPFLAARTLAKVRIFSGQPNEWISALHENIDKNQLPTYFGGTGTTALQMYQEKDKSSKYFGMMISPVKTPDNLTTININPGEQVLLTFDVTRANSIIKWEFRTDYYDVEFCVYKDGARENDSLVRRKRVCSQIKKIVGEIKCDSPGEYVAEFNNKYSDIRRAKTLRYRFQLLPPS